jgi:hypothetical protein
MNSEQFHALIHELLLEADTKFGGYNNVIEKFYRDAIRSFGVNKPINDYRLVKNKDTGRLEGISFVRGNKRIVLGVDTN